MSIGDLVVKGRGVGQGRIGIIVRIYKNSSKKSATRVVDVFTEGEVVQWLVDWCEYVLEEK